MGRNPEFNAHITRREGRHAVVRNDPDVAVLRVPLKELSKLIPANAPVPAGFVGGEVVVREGVNGQKNRFKEITPVGIRPLFDVAQFSDRTIGGGTSREAIQRAKTSIKSRKFNG